MTQDHIQIVNKCEHVQIRYKTITTMNSKLNRIENGIKLHGQQPTNCYINLSFPKNKRRNPIQYSNTSTKDSVIFKLSSDVDEREISAMSAAFRRTLFWFRLFKLKLNFQGSTKGSHNTWKDYR